MANLKKRQRYAGEGMNIQEPGSNLFTKPLAMLGRIWESLIGRRHKRITMTLTRDFYAAITKEPSYVILGEERYGMTRRIASLKKPLPTPPKSR